MSHGEMVSMTNDIALREAEHKPHPWDRMAGETIMWFHRFEIYLTIGKQRSLTRAYNVWRIQTDGPDAAPKKDAPIQWKTQCHRFSWVRRAELWDESEIGRLQTKQRQEIDKLFEHAMQATRAAYQKLTARLATLSGEDIPPDKVVPQFLAIVKKLEEQYGRTPTQKVEMTGANGGPIAVDIGVRQKVLRELDQLEKRFGLNWTVSQSIPEQLPEAIPEDDITDTNSTDG